MTSQNIDLMGVGSPVVDLLARVEDAFVSGIEGGKGGMELVDAVALKAHSRTFCMRSRLKAR